jgi:orotidine-5'-phosphate decarboxylase
MPAHLADRLAEAVRRAGSRVCVGLDPAADRAARALGLSPDEACSTPEAAADVLVRFNERIIEAVRPYCAVVKPQSAFYERWGAHGIRALERTIGRARDAGLLCILDVKRSDIASTAAAYAEAYLGEGPLNCDAITLNPYLGSDGVVPFLEEARSRGRGIFVLVRTSNPSSTDVQGRVLADGRAVYEMMGDLVEEWGGTQIGGCGYSDVGAVIGATFPAELAALRARLPHTWFLVPGYGRQGGTARDVAAAFDAEGLGAIVSNSSGIIYACESAGPGTDFPRTTAAAAREMRDSLEAARKARS